MIGKKVNLLILIGLLFSSLAYSQQVLLLTNKTNSEFVFQLKEIRKIDFTYNQIEIQTTDNNVSQFYISSLQNIQFRESSFTAVENFENKPLDFEIYPNPTSSKISIQKNQHDIAEVEIMDAQGKSLKRIHSDENLIDVEEFPIGIYFLSIELNDNSIIMAKFIKN